MDYRQTFEKASLRDLQAMAPWIAATLTRFQESENDEGSVTYARIQEALLEAIAEKTQPPQEGH